MGQSIEIEVDVDNELFKALVVMVVDAGVEHKVGDLDDCAMVTTGVDLLVCEVVALLDFAVKTFL